MSEKERRAISRREFGRRAAIASALASMAPGSAVSVGIGSGTAQEPLPANPASPARSQPPPLSNVPRLSPESQAEADARFQAILAQYGARFSEEQQTDIRRLCVLAQVSLDRLRSYPVQNGDGAGLYLKPLFEREKKPKIAAPAVPPVAKAPETGQTR